jgi:adenine-specific DNA-methyltransferase
LDFFGGSGTSPSVAHKMNKKYLAMEMGEYFDSKLLTRMKYTVCNQSGGIKSKKIGGFIKYYCLEQYEDTLHNTSFTNNTLNSKLTILDKYKETLPYLYENKFISLAKDVSLQNSSSLLLKVENEFLCNPFNYTLEIYKDNKYTSIKIDLVETFNTLMGFEINSIKQKQFTLNNKRYLFVDAKKEVVIWREVSKNEITEEFIEKEEEFIKEHIDSTKRIYMNGINSYYTKAFLGGQANEILYSFRKILMDGIKDGN